MWHSARKWREIARRTLPLTNSNSSLSFVHSLARARLHTQRTCVHMASSNERNHRLLYKAKPMESSQNRRRAQELERQRTARRTFTDLARNLIAKQATDADDMVSSSQELPPLPPSALMPPHCFEAGGSTIDAAAHMSTSASVPISTVVVDDGEAMITSSTTPTTTLLRKPSFYANLLMLPESLQEVPEDLASQWLMVVVPRGERCLVIASHGTTISRAQSGAKLERFASALPGGAFDAGGVHSSGDCILDCVYHEPSATYYVLDLLAWRGHLYYDCSTEFRCASLCAPASLPHVALMLCASRCLALRAR